MKAGIIFGLLALGLGASVTMLSSICLPFFALLIGLGAGYMGGFFDRPTESSGALRSGMWAGLIAGIFMVLGQILGTVGAATFLGPTRSALIVKSLGLPSFNPPGAAYGFIGGLIGMLLIVGVVNVLVMAVAGVFGGAIWWQTAGRQTAPTPDTGATSAPTSEQP
ncbi:MAG: hypothetical protein U0641_14635 [Anaerolineae bacterium]